MKLKINLDLIRFKRSQAQAVINWLIACAEILQTIGAEQDTAKLAQDGIEVYAPEGVALFNELGEEEKTIIFYPSDLADLLAAIEKVERKK